MKNRLFDGFPDATLTSWITRYGLYSSKKRCSIYNYWRVLRFDSSTSYKQNISTIDNIINNNMLIDQIKPEILAKLDKDYEKYNTSINYIYNVLATKEVYSQLTISEIKDIFTFASLDFDDYSPSDLLFGDRMLKQDYNYKYGK